MRKLALAVLLPLLVALIPQSVGGQPPAATADVTVNATGITVFPPQDFTVYTISDREVGIMWTKPAGAVNTMVRAYWGRAPTDRTDGVLVYYGSESHVVHWHDLDTATEPVYYKAWCETAAGDWDLLGADGSITGVGMTALLILCILAASLTVAMFATKNSLLGFPSAIFWGILGGYAYQRSLVTWDWLYILFFGAMGMVIFAMFAAYALRNRDLAGPDADRGPFIDEGGSPERSYIDESTRRQQSKQSYRPGSASVMASKAAIASAPRRGSWGDIDRLGMYDTDDSAFESSRAEEVRARARRRRAEGIMRPVRWGEFG